MTFDESIKYLENALLECKLHITDEKASQLLRYHELLIEKNKVMNLTAITDFEEAVWKHYADSLAVLKFIDLKNIKTLLDVGSGAGMPGIPLKIMCPEIQVTLLDAVQKKVNFHKEVIEKLKLQNIQSVHMRSEDAAHTEKMRQKYDLVTARAVANLTTLSEYCLPFVKTGGIFASYKAETAEQEIDEAKKAIGILGGSIEKTEHYKIGDNTRCMILIRKDKSSPNRYPRKAGIPSKEPIR